MKHRPSPPPRPLLATCLLSNVSASTAPAPVACAVNQPLGRPDLCYTFTNNEKKHISLEKHTSFDNTETLKQFLDAVDAGNDPFEQETPPCCNGFTIRGNLIWEVLEPQQDALFQSLKTYCNRTKRNLHLLYIRDSYKGEKGVARLFDLPITHFDTWSPFLLSAPLLEKCKETLRVLRSVGTLYRNVDAFGVLANLEIINMKVGLCRDLKAFGNCKQLHTAYFDGCRDLKDLTPLKDLQHLECLSLMLSDKVNIEPLLAPGAFPALRYLCLNEKAISKPEDLAALQEKIEKVVIQK